MSNCYCCDRARGHSLDPCGCSGAYCVGCAVCCRCPDPRFVSADGGEPDEPVILLSS